MLPSAVAKKGSRRVVKVIPILALKPALKPVIKPLIEPVVLRLDKHEDLLFELKTALDVQFRRIAAMQAQMDHLIATLRNRS